jgi:FkbM family methyltransferase
MQVFPKFNEIVDTWFGKMMCNVFDRYIGRSIITYGEFSHDEIGIFLELLASGSVVIEAGSNIGVHTLFLAQHVGPNGAVYAFEPQRIVFQTLCGNLALNSVPNVFAFQSALGSKPSTLRLPPINYRSVENFGGIRLSSEGAGESVPVTTIDSLNLSRCDLIKADVEGMEEDVLRGAEQTIQRFRPALYVESDQESKRYGLLRYIDSLGYAMFWHTPPLFRPNNFRGEQKDLFPSLVSSNVLCICKSKNPKYPALVPMVVN